MTVPIVHALEALARQELVVVADDVARVPRGFIAMSARDVVPERVNRLVTLARGVVCVGLAAERAAQLGLVDRVVNGNEHAGVFTRSVEASSGVSTGISAADRARTISVLGSEEATAASLVSPGHVFPVIAHATGVLGRAGEAEVVVDLMRLAGQGPVGAYCHVLGEDGNLAGVIELAELAEAEALPFVRVSELIRHRMEREFFVHPIADEGVETPWGPFRIVVFVNELDHVSHPVLIRGDLAVSDAPVVRIHSQCLTGDVFDSLRCDCGDQLEGALERIAQEPAGALVYLRQEGRGIGLVNKIRAYALQDKGKDTVDANLELGFAADQRSFVVAAQILKSLGVRRVRLITNNPRKVREIEQFGVEVAERVAMPVVYRAENARYLEVKAQRLGHMLDLDGCSSVDLKRAL